MYNLNDDSLCEIDIEDIIPAKKTNSCGLILLTISLFLCGMIILAFILPYPKVLRGKAMFNDNKKNVNLFLQPEETGKINKGQFVRLFIDNYPEYDYGCIEGTVVGFGNNGYPNEKGQYCILVLLEDGWTTNYGYTLSDDIHIQGTGEIILEKQKLIDVLIGPISSKIINK